MNILTDLRAALEAKEEAARLFDSLSPFTTVAEDWNDAVADLTAKEGDLNCLLTDDTIRALLNAAGVATIPANPTDQIAAVVATPAVEPDAQQYDWREDLDSIEACEEVWECADGCCTNFMPRHNDECIRLAAYIERLEAERDAVVAKLDSAELFLSTVHGMNEMNVVRGLHKVIAGEFTTFHDEVRLSVKRIAERVIHGE